MTGALTNTVTFDVTSNQDYILSTHSMSATQNGAQNYATIKEITGGSIRLLATSPTFFLNSNYSVINTYIVHANNSQIELLPNRTSTNATTIMGLFRQ